MSLDLGRGTASRSPREAMLERRLAELNERLRLVPSQFPDRAEATFYLFCRSGNALATVGSTTYYGLKQPAAPVETVPTVVPSTTDGACPDGLSWATLIADNGALSQVWVGVNLKPTADPAITDYTGILAYLTPFLSRRVVLMPLVSDATVKVPVFMPWRV